MISYLEKALKKIKTRLRPEQTSEVMDDSFLGYLRKRKRTARYKESRKKVRTMVIDWYNNKVKESVSPTGKPNTPAYEEFKTVRVTSEALEKANYLARRLSQLARTPLEIYLYAINLQSKQEEADIAIRDVYIGMEQNVYPDYCEISSLGQIGSMIDIERNLEQRIPGWVHSHGDMTAFFSQKDRENIVDVLFDRPIKKAIIVVEDNDYRLELDAYYSISLVVNIFGHQPYAVIAVDYPQFTGDGIKREITINEQVAVDIIHEQNDIPFDMADLDKQLLERVSVAGIPLSDIYARRNKETVRQ